MRVSQAPVYRRRRRIASGVAVAVVGMGLGMLSAELFWPGAGREGTLAEPAALTQVAASPARSASASPSSTPASSQSPSPSPVASADAAPVASPSPAFDLEARSVSDPDSIWVVVNKLRPLEPEDYAPTDLVTVGDVPGAPRLRAEAGEALAALHAAAAADGAAFRASTAYRDRDQQAGLYQGYVNRSGRERADRYSARPGYSEHQTGLSVDIHGGGCDLQACFGDTAAGEYVAAHAWEHGFIIRYPEDKESVTGYIYEPWHLRYVGTDLAAWMRDQGILTLEELFGLDPAPDYA